MGPSISTTAIFPNSSLSPEQLDELADFLSKLDSEGVLEERLDIEALELIHQEARQAVDRQASKLEFYQELGFKSSRSSIVILGIIVSAIAIFLEGKSLTLASIVSSRLIQIGIGGIILSIMLGNLYPVYLDLASQKSSSDPFTELLEKKQKGKGEKRDFHLKAINEYASIAESNSEKIHRLIGIIVIAQYTLISSTILIGWGLLGYL